MSGRYRLNRSFKDFRSRVGTEITEYSGVLGVRMGGQYLVEVPNRPGYYYVRLYNNLSELIIAFNNGKVSPVYDLPVLVARNATDQSRWYITGRDAGRYQNWGSTAYLPNHGTQHSFDPTNPGADPVWVWANQFMPVGAIPSGTNGALSVVTEPGYYYIDDDRKYLGTTGSPDLAPYKPTTSGKSKFVLLYGDVNGNPGIKDGAEFTSSLSGVYEINPYIPNMGATVGVPIKAIRLETGTSYIGWGSMIDVRPFFVDSVSGSGGGGSLPDLDAERSVYTDGLGTLTTSDRFIIAEDGTDLKIEIGGTNPSRSTDYDYTISTMTTAAGAGTSWYPLGLYGFATTVGTDVYYARGTESAPAVPQTNDIMKGDYVFGWITGTSHPGEWDLVGYLEWKALEDIVEAARGTEFDVYLSTTGSKVFVKALSMGGSRAVFNGLVQTPASNGYYWGDYNTTNSWRFVSSGTAATTTLDLQMRQSTGAWKSYIHTSASGTMIGNSGGGNYMDVNENGYVTFKGSATYWDDVLPYAVNPGTDLTALSSKQYGTTGFTMYYWQDNHGADETYQAFFQIPHKYRAGTDGHFHLHIIPSANGAGGNNVVVYVLQYQWVNINDSYNTSTNSIITGSFTVGASDANKHLLWDFNDLNGSGKTRSSDLMVRISRMSKTLSAIDNYTGDIYLRYTDVHIECDRLGTDDEV